MDHYVWEYRPASHKELLCIWNKNVAAHPGDERWLNWRDLSICNHENGMQKTFCVFKNGDPVGEGTLLFSPDCKQIAGRSDLADNSTIANINGLRIAKAYEAQGHISRLMRAMEIYARSLGYSALSIGVEAQETRNLAIYLHLGYSAFIRHDIEDCTLVLYYKKSL